MKLITLVILTILQVTKSQNCVTEEGDRCVFPFIYQVFNRQALSCHQHMFIRVLYIKLAPISQMKKENFGVQLTLMRMGTTFLTAKILDTVKNHVSRLNSLWMTYRKEECE